MTCGASQKQPMEVKKNLDHDEPMPKRAENHAQKGGSPQKKQKAANAPKPQPLAAKVPW